MYSWGNSNCTYRKDFNKIPTHCYVVLGSLLLDEQMYTVSQQIAVFWGHVYKGEVGNGGRAAAKGEGMGDNVRMWR